MARKINDADKALFKTLRKAGAIPKDWRQSDLTDYKVKKLRSLGKELKDFADKPGKYISRRVNADTGKALKGSGYKVIPQGKDKAIVFIPKAGAESVRIQAGRKRKDGSRSTPKIVIKRMRRIETVYVKGGIALLESIAETINAEKLDGNTFWALKVGQKSTILQQEFESIEDCIDYYYSIEAYLPDNEKNHLQLVKIQFID